MLYHVLSSGHPQRPGRGDGSTGASRAPPQAAPLLPSKSAPSPRPHGVVTDHTTLPHSIPTAPSGVQSACLLQSKANKAQRGSDSCLRSHSGRAGIGPWTVSQGPAPSPTHPPGHVPSARAHSGAQLRAQADEDAHRSPPEVTTCPPSLRPPPELPLGLVGEDGLEEQVLGPRARPCPTPSPHPAGSRLAEPSPPAQRASPRTEGFALHKAKAAGRGSQGLAAAVGGLPGRGGLPGGGKQKCRALEDKGEVTEARWPVQAMPAAGRSGADRSKEEEVNWGEGVALPPRCSQPEAQGSRACHLDHVTKTWGRLLCVHMCGGG